MQKKQLKKKNIGEDKLYEKKRAEEFKKFMKAHFEEIQGEDCKKVLK
jgi:hypothetical protein